MNAATILHYFFLAAASFATVALLFVRNVFYGALLLIITLLCLAGLYVLSFAEFLAITQILVYAGGILVVIIFAIMLTSHLHGKPLLVDHSNRLAGGLVGATLLGFLIYLIVNQFPVVANGQVRPFSISTLGRLLLTEYALPFEVTGVVLLIALIGAAVIASSSAPKHPGR
ncbi:MAG TPA: NADH-quinone oxidoreductase subunit J [Chryseolinea sp.]|nr:NADH-quinone oxidoreductase subunit J [Chryseolinea sp.]